MPTIGAVPRERPLMNGRTEQLLAMLDERILLLDGATGTMLQSRNLAAKDFGGPDKEGCFDYLVMTRPDIIRWVHESYLEAGSNLVETDTFGATPLVLQEYGLRGEALEINRRAAEIAREACDRFSTPSGPRFVAGSMGPTTRSLSVTGGTTFEELSESYRIQAAGLVAGGADVLLLETSQDSLNVKAGLLGIRRAMDEAGIDLPVMVSATIEPMGTMLAGQDVEAFYASVMHAPLLSVGLNCATGPDFMASHLRALSALARTRISCHPNAGLPDEDGRYALTPENMAAQVGRFAREGWVNIVGGCCGTTPDHVRALAEAVRGVPPRRVPDYQRTFLSGIDFLELEEDNRPVLVGERTNVLGSKAFRNLISAGRIEEAAEIARDQVKAGAQVVDICLQDPDRDEMADMESFLEKAGRMVRAPFMIDSTDAAVIERALTFCQGRSVINSVNLEDGEARFQRVVPLARTYGSTLVVQTIDDDPAGGMAVTREKKLSVARRSFELLTTKYGVPAEDIIFDPLVFPCGTGDEAYAGSAGETIEGIRAIKAEFPVCKTIAGISNVSFGLPAAGRSVLNSVFLYHCTRAGLDMAIVNAERIVRYPSIPPGERALSEDLLFDRGTDPIGAFNDHFKGRKSAGPATRARAGTPMERIGRCIIEGTKAGLISDLDELRAGGMTPLDIINGPLMGGMAEVGRLFAANELIVAEVLQSAAAMKAAVSHLEKFMKKTDRRSRGKILLATVKGDVHDIGKNLVDIVLSNNGYEVVNLGIKVPSEKLIQACAEHSPDYIGLSGLLVKSALQMVTTADDLTAAGLTPPLLVGGAALTEKFTDVRIAPAYGGFVAYARDAMAGLDLLNRLSDQEAGRALRTETEARRSTLAERRETAKPAAPEAPAVRSPRVEIVPGLGPPDGDERVLEEVDLEAVWPYLNPQMLYGKHLGLRGSFLKLKEAGNAKALELEAVIRGIQEAGWLKGKALYRFFRAGSDGNTLRLAGENVRPVDFRFPRQRSGGFYCISDFVRPASEKLEDSVALFVVTAGEGVRRRAESLKRRGEYLLCHALQALALETAEAAAEWLHRRIREEWGFPDPEDMTMLARFQARYRGARYSFGYPACPDLAHQEALFGLLRPERIGVRLTEGYMMDPEASVSALVVHHPQAHYFAV
jgi:5-methyltetrahydrofolate--homocysteine methyltransferase